MNNTTRTSLLSRLASQLQKHALLVTSAAVLASPLVSHADANAAMDACVKAFVEANVPKDHPIRVRKVNAVDRSLGAPDRAYRVSLTVILAHRKRQEMQDRERPRGSEV